MTPLAAKILIFGIPLALSLGWFLYWVVRLSRAGRRARSATGAGTGNGTGSGGAAGGKPPTAS